MYDNNMDAYFELNNGLDISAYDDVTVRFWTWYKMRPTGEYFSFEYLSGGSWVELDRWTGSDEEWEEHTFTIPSDAGSTLYFRWFFHSDGSGRREGVYVDDVVVEGVDSEALRAGGGEGEALHMENRADLLQDDLEIPGEFRLEQNYPNPFNPSTRIGFSVPEDAHTTLTVYDVLGREVARLVDGWTAAGNYYVSFQGNGLANGMYIYRLDSGTHRDTKRMMLLK
jgi:hypothetical protein